MCIAIFIEDEVSGVSDPSEVKARVPDSLIASEGIEDDRRGYEVPVNIEDVINHKEKAAKKLYHTLPVYLVVVMVPAVDNRELLLSSCMNRDFQDALKNQNHR